MSGSKSRTGCLILISFILFALLLMGVLRGMIERQSQFYIVEFKQAEGLRRQHRVELGGEEIGFVTYVRQPKADAPALARIRVNPRFHNRVLRGAVGVLRGGGFLDGSDRRTVEIVNPEETPPPAPLAAGATLTGLEGELDYQAWKMRGSLSEAGGLLTRIGEIGGLGAGSAKEEKKP